LLYLTLPGRLLSGIASCSGTADHRFKSCQESQVFRTLHSVTLLCVPFCSISLSTHLQVQIPRRYVQMWLFVSLLITYFCNFCSFYKERERKIPKTLASEEVQKYYIIIVIKR
jgi:hypothetical protein